MRIKKGWWRGGNAAPLLLLAAVIAGSATGQLIDASGLRHLRESLLGTPAQVLVIAPFFFLVGLELRRELKHGTLKPLRNAAAPVLGAVMGVALPALWFWGLTADTPFASGWPIPTATDVTFALAIYVAFGSALPRAARTFLLTFAVIDDLIAVILITFVFGFSGDSGFAELLPIVLAFFVPLRWPARVEAYILRWLNWVGLPLFAFFMVAVPLPSIWDAGRNIVFWSVVARPLWKMIGIFLGGTLGNLAIPKPKRLPKADLLALASLGGIGFTVSLLVAGIAFKAEPEAYSAAVLATFLASGVSAVAGALLLLRRHGS